MKLNDTTASFALARTNPKLTGNVKITIDSDDNIWLNSIDANKELANSKFKKFSIEDTSSYPVDLYKFFDEGNTPEEIVFDLHQKFSTPDSVSVKYEDQYDLFYAMGAQLNISNQYKEKNSFFAPIWIKDTLPDYFIICRIKDPLDFPYNDDVPSGQIETGKLYKVIGSDVIYEINVYKDGETFLGASSSSYIRNSGEGSIVLLDENKNYPFSIPQHFETIIDKVEVIKTFNLTEASKIGKYIKKIKSSNGFSESPITVRFEEELLTTYNGIGYREGVLVKKGEYLDSLWERGISIIDFEETITGGFERQGVICANLLNLEFLFDDTETDLYTIPRYLGFYVSKNDLGKFKLSGEDLYAWRNVAGNNEIPKRDEHGYDYQELDYIQTNENGVRLFIKDEDGIIPDSTLVQQDLRLFYIQDKNDKFHSLSRNVPFGNDTNFKDLIVRDTILNLKDFSGRGIIKLQSRGELTNEKGTGYAVIKILGNLLPNDSIKIYWTVGDLIDGNGRYDLFTANDLTFPLGPANWGPGSSYQEDYFHPYGTPNQIANAIAGAMNKREGRNFTAFAIEDEVVIRANSQGSFSNVYNISVNMTDPTLVKIQNQIPVNGALYNWEGGTDRSNIRIVRISLSDSARLSTITDYIETNVGLSKISHIGRYVDDLKKGTLQGFNSYASLYIEDLLEEPTIGNSRSFKAVELYDTPVGVFTFFDVKEIDGDFLSSTYGKSPINEIHRYFDLKPNEPVLEVNKVYIVIGEGIVNFNGINYPKPSVFPEPSLPNISFRRDSGENDFFTVVSGNPIVIGLEFFRDTYPVNFTGKPYLQISNPNIASYVYLDLDNLDKGLGEFHGFETLRALTNVTDELLIPGDSDLNWRFRNKFSYGEIYSEYDYSKENFTTDRAIKSRLIPYINKWVYQGGKDVRDNPYRLNNSLAFGSLNFAPSFNVRKQDPASFTHEWYYLEKFPEFYSEELKKDTYSYFNEKIDRSQLVNADPSSNYFLDYFTVDEGDGMESLQERFSIFNFNKETGFAETLFRGVKIKVLDVVLGGTSNIRTINNKPPFIDGSTKFDDYKFSSILTIRKPDQTKIESPINIEVIENKTNKTITFLIELIINDYRIDIHDPILLQNAINSSNPLDWAEDKLFNESILDYFSLYSLKDKRKLIIPPTFSGNSIINGIDDIKLNVGLNLSFPSGSSLKYGNHWKVLPFDNVNYDWNLTDEIHSFESNNIFTTNNIFLHDIQMPFPEVAESDKLYLNKYDQSLVLQTFNNLTTAVNFIIPNSSSNAWKNRPVFQKEGGKLFLEPIMERISLAEIAHKINNYSKFIKYTSVEWIANQTVETVGQFYLEFLPPTKIKKIGDVNFSIDQDKPEELKTTAVIGYNLGVIPVDVDLYRYSGPYEPKFKDLLFFGNQKDDSILSKDLRFDQTKFNPEVPSFGIIEKFNYLKVSEKGIGTLTLAKNNKYIPLYPIIDETAIGNKNFYIFHSNWDPGYFQESVTKGNPQPRAGTREMREYKSFFGSKIMKTRTNLKMETIKVSQVPILANINLNLISDEIIFEETDTLIRGIISVDKRLVRFLIEDGADKYFKEHLISEFGTGDSKSIEDDIDEYLRENILPSYFLQSLVIYSKQSQEVLPAVVGNLTDKDKIANGYSITKNIGVSKISDFIWSFELVKNESFNTSLAMSIIIAKI